MTWVDGMLFVLLVAFTVGGLLRGTIAQVFAFLGLLFGAWAMLVVGRWIGDHWHDARPAAVFVTLRWLVASLSALAIAAFFQWWGNMVARAVHEGPLGWADRLGGGAIGAVTGLAVTALLMLLLLQAPVYASTGGIASRGACSKPLVEGGVAVTRAIRTSVPWGTWLYQQFLSASRRLERGATPARVAIGQ